MSAERYTPERLMAWADRATQFSERDVMRRLAEEWEREIKRLRAERDQEAEMKEAHASVSTALQRDNTALRWERNRLREALDTTTRECKIARSYAVPSLQPSISKNLDAAIAHGNEALAATDVQEAKPDE